jgi:hypothetical protein
MSLHAHIRLVARNANQHYASSFCEYTGSHECWPPCLLFIYYYVYIHAYKKYMSNLQYVIKFDY